ncbi:E3 ubiquitin-protein ligase SIAH2-like [Panicum virgatum]|uniref:RING-type E3 ubiquitin transferase n=1 Tax=Panicum virgatum TaxID=38727 RepID=A0A8T0SFW8_PANVG|nr:E3 ubiquitin-protein ligase SIAH2-like [Panicum virgatum]KAG2595975.1 hypothetical protein PVAP13_5KG121600 [Panicum virgatum]
MRPPRPPSTGSDAPGLDGAREEPQPPSHPLAANHGRQESKPREAGVVVSFGARPAGAAPAPARPRRLTTVLVVDKARLCCSLCSLALKRPIYQCAAGHLACGGCRTKLSTNACRTCGDGGAASAYALCPGLDVFYGELHLPCPYEAHGCRSYIPYYRAASHQSACEHAPCLCPEPGCAFAAPPRALLAHLVDAHSWPVHKIPRFGAIQALHVPAAGPPDRLLVVAEEEEAAAAEEDDDDDGDDAEGPAVFVLSVRARGEAAAVSVACLRANARAGPQYKCVLWAKAPAPRGAAGRRRLCMETDVPSCAQPGEAAVEDGMWLGVAPVMMLGASREIHLGVQIDKL